MSSEAPRLLEFVSKASAPIHRPTVPRHLPAPCPSLILSLRGRLPGSMHGGELLRLLNESVQEALQLIDTLVFTLPFARVLVLLEPIREDGLHDPRLENVELCLKSSTDLRTVVMGVSMAALLAHCHSTVPHVICCNRAPD